MPQLKRFDVKVSVNFTEEQVRDLDDMAAQLDLNRSDVIRRLVVMGMPLFVNWLHQGLVPNGGAERHTHGVSDALVEELPGGYQPEYDYDQ